MKKISVKTKWLIYQIWRRVLVHCACICNVQIMSQGFGSLLYVLHCPYLISRIMDGMKMVESNGCNRHFLMTSLNYSCSIMTLMMIQKILLWTMAVISRVIVKKIKVGTRSKNVFLICVANVVYEKMMSFCKTILIT